MCMSMAKGIQYSNPDKKRFERKYCFSYPHIAEKKHYKWTVFFFCDKNLENY